MFYGIIIRMYCAPAEHEPPHIHVYYQDYNAILDVQKCELVAGNLPRKQLHMVLAWMEIHQEELLANWILAQRGEIPFRIEPLR